MLECFFVCVTNRTRGVFGNISFLKEGFNREYVMANLPEQVAGVWGEVFGPQPPPDSEAIRWGIYNSFRWGDDRGKKTSVGRSNHVVESARAPPLSVNVSSFLLLRVKGIGAFLGSRAPPLVRSRVEVGYVGGSPANSPKRNPSFIPSVNIIGYVFNGERPLCEMEYEICRGLLQDKY
jgi:hypothetical protein